MVVSFRRSSCSVSTIHEERLDEEKVDDVDDNLMKESENKENKEDEEEEEPAVPVPRVKVGPDGRIVIDEQSLVSAFRTVISLSLWMWNFPPLGSRLKPPS